MWARRMRALENCSSTTGPFSSMYFSLEGKESGDELSKHRLNSTVRVVRQHMHPVLAGTADRKSFGNEGGSAGRLYLLQTAEFVRCN